ncbi:MAG: HAMP domain-containing sensor histidine kinase [Paludibacteraceae bacterium]
MAKQILLALGVLIILIISQLIWFNQLWELDKRRLQSELTSEISNMVNFQSLAISTVKNKYNQDECPMIIKDGGEASQDDILATNSITTEKYSSDKSLGKMVENAFMDLALQANQIKVSFVDSVFQKSYPRIGEVSYYSLRLCKYNRSIDSISYGKKPIISPFNVDIPLGSKKTYHFKADFNLKPSVQVRNMLFSIGITSVAIILVAFFMIFQLVLLRRKTKQLQWREQSVSGIIHDLKSPLSYVYTMLGFFESIEKETVKKQNLNTAKIRVKYLSEKIELLLSVFKAGSSKLVMNKTPYNFSGRCTELMEELKLIYKDKQITYSVLSPANLNLNVDNIYFEGCVRNLLDNAIKYSPGDAEITVSSEQKNNRIFLYFKRQWHRHTKGVA